MAKGLNVEKRTADVIGGAVRVARIASGEEPDTGYVSKNSRRSGAAAAEVRMSKLTETERSAIATRATKARWKTQEATMDVHDNACDSVAALYREKAAAGLVDVKFFVDDAYKATREAVCKEVLRLEQAIKNGEFEELVFNDRH